METSTHKSKRKMPKIEEMTKEQISQTIIKKRECNAKAQKIVESLLERSITEKFFLQCLPDINQCHFDDIVEERAIIQLCGYPICQNKLSTKDIPKQTYRISLKTNKVYDITTRKSFCSNSCYKSAVYVKRQMLTSPLWFREYEEVPNFHLLPYDTIGSLGQEVDLGLVEKIETKSDNKLICVNELANAAFTEMGSNIEVSKSIEANQSLQSNLDNINNEGECNYSSNYVERRKIENEFPNGPKVTSLAGTSKVEKKKKSLTNPLNIVGDIVEKPERKIDPILQCDPYKSINKEGENTRPPKVTKKKQPKVTILTIEVEKCLAEWFTVDTLLLIFGEEKTKEMLTDKGECIKEYLNNYAKSVFYTSNSYDQYQALCRKLNMLELEEKRLDAHQTLQRETKPLPDYSILQEESKRIQLKVKAFFSGETEISEINDIGEKPENEYEENSQVTQLPLVHKHAQNALRRRIVCEHLNKVLPDILKSLGMLSLSISSDVRLLVNTFQLKANNIMFKPIQWTLIAIIVIKLLSLRDKRLEYLLEQPTAFQHLQLLLLSYNQDGGYLDRLISWLTDTDRLLDTNDTQLTVE
ncbi:unnamed protein product [Diatraea saccharalis]|uniref:RNA polymerase II subunit B1 CTD phosphatase RPAP2 homolog n=1 Tax=Diatraea saccharalis TaxID=40085 RepID=A0A9N9W8L0_9NEOP|nr:unnamed protein product [Diatraea saccharalis]